MVLHTEDQCSVSGGTGQTGVQQGTQCAVSAGPAGCAVAGGPFGDAFNAIGGGVYAMEWKAGFIKMWFFPRGRIPLSIRNGAPKPALFGTPLANFAGSCDIPGAGCPATAGASNMQSCINYVAGNPGAFAESYWEINSLKVYKNVVSRPRRSVPVAEEMNENANHVETIFGI